MSRKLRTRGVDCVGPQRDMTESCSGALASDTAVSVLPSAARAVKSSNKKSSSIASPGRSKWYVKKGAVPSRR